jgi:hypothetical protein
LYLFSSCSVENDVSQPIQTATPKEAYTYLALGDSYTIGESVCETCRFPAQLSKKLGIYIQKIHIPIKLLREQAGLQPTCFLLPLKILFQLRFSHFTYWCKQPISKQAFFFI